MCKLIINDIKSNPSALIASRVAEGFVPSVEVSVNPHLIACARLASENLEYAGTGGVSQNNHEYGFIPAFRDEDSQKVVLSKLANGQIAPIHVLEGIPSSWFLTEKGSDRSAFLKESITSGFVRQGQFYTRKQAAAAVKIFNLEDTCI